MIRLLLAAVLVVGLVTDVVAQPKQAGPQAKPDGETARALSADRAAGRAALGALRAPGAGLVRPGRDDGRLPDPVLDPLRAARCAREADARQSHGAEPGRVVDCERRSARVRVQA